MRMTRRTAAGRAAAAVALAWLLEGCAATAPRAPGETPVPAPEPASAPEEPAAPPDVAPAGGAVPDLVASANSLVNGHGPQEAVDGRLDTWWEAGRGTDGTTFTLAFGRVQGLGGLVVDWQPGHAPAEFIVETHGGDFRWRPRLHVTGSRGNRAQLYLPGTQAAEVRLRVVREGAQPAAICEVSPQPPAWSATPEDFQMNVARAARRGLYPRAYLGEPTAWAPVGRAGDTAWALLTRDGAIESGNGAFTLEPFLVEAGRLVTWNDAHVTQSLVNDVLPIPQVTWESHAWRLTATAAGAGPAGRSFVLARYRVENLGAKVDKLRLVLAVRPLQAAPRVRRADAEGAAKVAHLALGDDGRTVLVNEAAAVQALTAPTGFAASTFYGGDIVAAWLEHGDLPADTEARSELNAASGALWWDLVVAPGGAGDVVVALPLHGAPAPVQLDAEAALIAIVREWQAKLGGLPLKVPADLSPERAAVAAEAIRVAQAQVGWLLATRDGAALQPGTRGAARPWVAHGALAAEALLRLGLTDEARDFLLWCAPHQADSGRMPGVIGAVGPDQASVPDATGAFIHLAARAWDHTHDRALAEALWPRVARGAGWLAAQPAPASPFLDEFFRLRGLAAAAWLAGELQAVGVKGTAPEAKRLAALRDRFAGDLQAAVQGATAAAGPEAADAAALASALDPCDVAAQLPAGALERTFDRYWAFFNARREVGDHRAFALDEMRCLGALARLGQTGRAWDATAWFLAQMSVPGWRVWGEVAPRDAAGAPTGDDMPNGWMGADFVRGICDLAGEHGSR